MTVRVGRAATVLKQMVAELDAGLVVLGGKHHSMLERWLAGSTSINVVRTTEVPVLVTGGSRAPIRHVLAAVDLSAAAAPTIRAAEQFADLVGAKVRVVSVLEPLPIIPEAPNYELSHYYAMMEDRLARDVWPLVASPYADKVVRHGAAVETVMQEAAEWHADVVVVGSHGKGLVDRLLIGSATERLLNHLPTSLLVVPVYAVGTVRDAVQRIEGRPEFAHAAGS
jgi:nucleotide-binding universal stress UspA family protein